MVAGMSGKTRRATRTDEEACRLISSTWAAYRQLFIDKAEQFVILAALGAAEDAEARYLAQWRRGMPVPAGFVECDGERPPGEGSRGNGPHLRRGRMVRHIIESRRAGQEAAADHTDWFVDVPVFPGERLTHRMGELIPYVVREEPRWPDIDGS